MRSGSFVLAALIAAAPAAATEIEPYLEPGEEIESQVEGDLNGDGRLDLAYISRAEDKRTLCVLLSVVSEVDFGVEPAQLLPLDAYPLGPGSLSIARNVLVFEDLTGGTTAVSSTRRYRFEAQAARMRLIGLDATVYSRTFAHDGFELSWNLLNGDLVTRTLPLNQNGGDAAYDPVAERKSKRRTDKIWIEDTPDPEALIAELSGA